MPEAIPAAPAPAVAPRRFEIPAETTAEAPPPPSEIVVPDDQKPADQAPATPPGSEAAKPATVPDPEKQSSRRFERRLDKAYRRAADATARAELLEKENAKLRLPAAATDPEAPKLENFKDIEEYAGAREKYAADKALKEHTSKQHGEARKQEHARLASEWEVKAERAAAKYDDFDEIVPELTPDNVVVAAIMEAENAEDVAYHLFKDNKKEAIRIGKLGLTAQIREIGKLEAKLAAEPPKPKTPSKAPAPITPVSGAAPVVSDVPSEQDEIGAWIRKRSKAVHAKR